MCAYDHFSFWGTDFIVVLKKKVESDKLVGSNLNFSSLCLCVCVRLTSIKVVRADISEMSMIAPCCRQASYYVCVLYSLPAWDAKAVK